MSVKGKSQFNVSMRALATEQTLLSAYSQSKNRIFINLSNSVYLPRNVQALQNVAILKNYMSKKVFTFGRNWKKSPKMSWIFTLLVKRYSCMWKDMTGRTCICIFLFNHNLYREKNFLLILVEKKETIGNLRSSCGRRCLWCL